MCGIGGILLREPGDALVGVADRLLIALSHRGPDDRALHFSPQGDVLVHSRLAIQGPDTAGRQPMSRSGCTITFNGEIYNFRALRETLRGQGCTFTSETDTEVLLALYARDGLECLDHLRGMFALAIWDETRSQCFLARDRFGIKPLYYGVTSRGILVFASELKALLATKLFTARLSAEALDGYLATGSVAEPDTMLAGIHCLPAGHYLCWNRGSLQVRRYYDVDLAPPFPTTAAGAATHEEVQTALLDSVRHHFISDVPVGLFLSGGIDSGALLALSHAAGRKGLPTFSIALESADHDEAQAARARAAEFGARHHEMLLTRELAGQWVERFLDEIDQPTVDGFNTYCAAKLAADHGYRVILSGVGGDELFGGYPSFRNVRLLLAAGKLAEPLGFALRPLARLCESIAPSGRVRRLAGFFQGPCVMDRAYQTVRSIFSPRERAWLVRAITGRDFSAPVVDSPHADLAAKTTKNEISRLEFTRYLRNQLLRDADVMGMAHGVEVRVPFVDHKLISVLRRVPSKERFSRGKALLRSAAHLPTKACSPHRAKRGFSLPMDEWMRRHWRCSDQTPRTPRGIPLDSWGRRWSLIVLQRWLRRENLEGLIS